MDEFVGSRLDGIANTIRRKRTQTSRRPRPDSQAIPDNQDLSPSSTPPSDDVSKVSSDENGGYHTNFKRKEFNLNQCVAKLASATELEGDRNQKRSKGLNGGFKPMYGSGAQRHRNDQGAGNLERKRCSEGVLAPANWKNLSKVNSDSECPSVSTNHCGRNDEHQNSGMNIDGLGNENKVKKVKLKVGGVTRTIQANSATTGATAMWDGTSSKNSLSSEASHQRQRALNLQDNSDDNHSPPNKRSGLKGVPWKDFSVGFNLRKNDPLMEKMKHGDKSEPVRKSKRVPKRRVMDGAFDDDDDDELRYLEKVRAARLVSPDKEDEDEASRKHRSVSKMSTTRIVDTKHDDNLKRLGKDYKKKSKLDGISEDTDYEEEDVVSECELESKKKKPKKESIQALMEGKRELSLTTRQRALQSGKDASSANSIEFPNGLPAAPSRRQKEKLTDVEQQLKKAEAAQRRRLQVEKAARESEAEAIRKILGQDSSRKKREDKLKKRREELAQEKAANALVLASNTVRWVIGPTGTTVTFANNLGLPSIFDPKPCSYPPPRESCAGPSCTNPYKYRDSKSRLPLCSLQCYKAIREKSRAEATC